MESAIAPESPQRGLGGEPGPSLPPGTLLSALRVWGQANHLVETRGLRYGPDREMVFNVEITGHDLITLEVADGTDPDPAVVVPSVSRHLASQHTKIRQDRNSDPDSFVPFANVLWKGDENDKYKLVLVYMFDRAGAQGNDYATTDSRFLPQPIPEDILADAIDAYLNKDRLPQTPAGIPQSLPIISRPISSKLIAEDPSEVIRGRRRRMNRRHGFCRPSTLPTSKDLHHNREEQALPRVEAPKDELLVRGRARRLQRRHKLHVRKPEQAPEKNTLPSQALRTPKPTPSLPYPSINLEQRLPTNWRGSSCIHILGPTEDDFSDAIVLPLSISQDRQRLLTSLAFSGSFMRLVDRDIPEARESDPQPPKEVYDPPKWMPRLTHGMPHMNIDRLLVGAGLSNHEDSLLYWQKFPLSAVGHLREDEWHKRSQREINFFGFSRWLCFGCPQIIYADQERSLPRDLDYAQLFVCDRSIFSVTRRRPDFPTWMSEMSSLWYDEQLDLTEGFSDNIFKVTRTDVPYHKADGTTEQLNFNRKLGGLLAQAGSYYLALADFEALMQYKLDFTTPFSWKSRKRVRQSIEAPKDNRKSLQGGSPTPYGESNPVESKEIWYCPWEQSHIPFWQQEQTLKRIQALSTSTDECLADFVKAHATLEYGICLLNGFGIEQNIDAGLQWIRRAAEQGSRLASAVTPCLWRAYGRHSGSHEYNDQVWTMQEAIWLSPYAQQHLELLSPENYHSTRQNMLYTLKYSIDWPFDGMYVPDDDEESRFMHYFVKEVIKKLAMKDAVALRKQLRFEDPALWELLIPLISNKASPQAPRLFYRAMMRWVCCHGEVPVLRQLIEDGLGFLAKTDIEEFLMLTVHRGHASLTLCLLDTTKVLGPSPGSVDEDGLDFGQQERKLGFNMLFLLHHFPDNEVEVMVKRFVAMGFDVNEKAPIDKVRRQATYPCSPDDSSCTATYNTWDLHLHDDIRGFSMTPLRWAIIQNKPALVRALLDAGACFPLVPPEHISQTLAVDSWAPNSRTITVLDQPCYNTDILRIFLERHGHQQQPVFAESPLGLIAMEPDNPMRRVRIAQQIGGDPDALFPVLSLLRRYQRDSDAELFWAAAMNGHADIVRYLIAQGVSVELRWKGMTPFHTSILYGRKDIFILLLHNRADVFATTTDREISAIHLLFWRPKPAETELFMLEKLYTRLYGVAGHHGKFSASVTPLHLAVLNSRPEVIERLIDLGADTTAALGEEIMPSILGCQFTAQGIEDQIRQAKAAPSGLYGVVQVPHKPVEIKGYTAAGIVFLREDMFLPRDAAQILKLLLTAASSSRNRGVEAFYTRPDIKQTVLHLLVWSPLRENTELRNWVLERSQEAGIHLNTPDVHGDTPLHYGYAVQGPRFHRDINDLIKHGASITQRNNLGLTPPETRTAILANLAPSDRGPLEITMSLHLPRFMKDPDSTPQGEPPASLSPTARLLWSLEEKSVTLPVVWDCKARKMVTLPPLSMWTSKGLEVEERKDGFEVALKTSGWRDAVEQEKQMVSDLTIDATVLVRSPDDIRT